MLAAAALDSLRAAGFTFRADSTNRLIVAPSDRLSAEQRESIRQHKAALLRLLDVETLLHALATASTAGLAWREGTPPNWSDDRLLTAGEVLYQDRRMVNVLGRRYLAACAPRMIEQWSDTTPSQTTPQTAPSAPRNGIAMDPPPVPATDRMDSLRHEEDNNPQAARIAELIAEGWDSWNAKACAESEALPGWQHPQVGGGP